MKLSTYKLAVELQSRMHNLEVMIASLEENNGSVNLSGYDKDAGGTIDCDTEVLKKINEATLAILKLELRTMSQKFSDL